MTTDTLAKLAACPFCGGKAAFDHDDHGWNWIYCTQCDASTNQRASLMEDCKPLLAEAWNRRALTAQALPAAEPTQALAAWARSPELVEPGNDWQQGYEHARAWVHVQLSTQQAQFTGIAACKLADLQGQGYQVNGYSLMHAETRARGFIDSGGFVGWWSSRDHEQAATPKAALVAEFGERMAGYGEGFDDGKGVAERHAAQATAEWQPIETAPKDGANIWAFNGEQGVMHWIDVDVTALWVWEDDLLSDADPEPIQPTHWQPLPAPPAALPQPQPQSAQAKGGV